MAGLQRSSETFRRSGSSGMVWEDKNMSASGKETMAPAARTQRSGSGGHGGGYKAGNVQPALDPPSPRVAACGFCGIFSKDSKEAPQPRHRAGGKGKRR
ncbi:uncharacterized protein At1g15400-like [Lolium rigidum]|uniref:uncharacterized protein At1g15400-like n=1 Tax=Lolium rigidum TaxID=89674 RepID=UPI001F5DF5F6|nr:uncharacterized protein At1g15400-like [Lolium rigidum]XP_051220578.1 uncharacterized protein At1g15400-like [Lolium perenne]